MVRRHRESLASDAFSGLGAPPSRWFSEFYGVQLVDHFAVHENWSLMLGAGVGRTSYDLPSGSTESTMGTGGIASIGLQWKPATHYSMSLEYSYLTESGVGTLGLLAQVPF